MTFAEFFAGIGLVRLGLESSGWKCCFANDIDPSKLEMYKAKFSDWRDHFVLNDIRNLDHRDIPEVTLATASFPCTDLSLAGGRAGLQGKQSSALWPFLELLEKMVYTRPPLVLLENVTGFLTSNHGKDFRTTLQALNRLGYAVDAFILDASSFTPQSRQRLFVVAAQSPTLRVEEQRSHLRFFESRLRPAKLAEFILQNLDLRWCIRDLPTPPERAISLDDILEDVPLSSELWWSNDRAQYLLNQMSERHRDTMEAMIRSDKWSYATVFRRVRNGRSMAEVRTDGVAGCLRTPKGGSGRQILTQAGFDRFYARLLTPRECARLMGAGDDYPINVMPNQALFGFGDAVCVPVIDWIATNYLNPVLSELRSAQRYTVNA